MIGKAILRWIIAIIAILAIIIIVMLTPLGLKISLSLAEKLLPGHLQYQQVSGIITGPIEVKGLQYSENGRRISINRLKLNWRLLTLLQGKLTITHLKVNGVHITLGTTPQKEKAAHAFQLPFMIQIDQANLHDIAIGKQPNRYPVFIPNMSLTGTIIPNKVDIQMQATLARPYPMQTRLEAKGNFSHYTLTLRLSSRHFTWTIYGKGNDQGIHLRTQESQTLGGSLSGNADIRWTPRLQWKLNLNARNLNFNKLQSTWPRQLNLRLSSQGHLEKQQARFSLTALIKTPQAQLNIIVKRNASWNIKWDASIAQLASLIPGSRGSLQSKGQWVGDIFHPFTKGNIQANNLVLFGYQASNLKGNWLLYPNDKKQSTFNVTAANFSTKTIKLAALQLQGKGTRPSHQLSGKVTVNSTQFIFKMKGGVFGDQWKGQLQQLNIASKQFRHWRLIKPDYLTLSTTQIVAPHLCFRSTAKNSRLCVDGQWNANKAWKFTVKGQDIDPGLLTHLALPKLILSAPTNIDATVTGYRHQLQQATATITLKSGRFRYALNGNFIASPFKYGNMFFRLDNTSFPSVIFTFAKICQVGSPITGKNSPT